MSLREKGISVVLPNYNHGRYIHRALDAILAQGFVPYEIVIVDDGSTDDSLAIIEKLTRASPFIRVLKNSTNEGHVAAQMRGLAVATGQYIHLAAADDLIFPGFYSLARDMLEAYPEAGLFTGDSALLDGASGRFLSTRPIVMPSFKPSYIPPSLVRNALAKSDNWILTGASVIRAEAIRSLGGLDADLGSFADGYLTRKIALTRGYCYAPQLVSTWSIFPTSASRVVALDHAKATKMWDVTREKLSADPIFPAWYADRFADRWRFATSRLALQQEKINIPFIMSIGVKAPIDRAAIAFIFTISKGWLGRVAASAWLFARFRPYRLVDLTATFIFRKLFKRQSLE
jgi:glycosyltransferase involved in cell wall biosynthesis